MPGPDSEATTAHPVSASAPPRAGRRRRAPLLRRHPWRTAIAALLLALSPVAWSFGRALADPTLGGSLGARAAEWARDHGGASLVAWAENEWYSHHAPPVGGRPAAGAVPAPPRGLRPSAAAPTAAALPPHLAAPAPLRPFVSDPFAGEGVWRPAGRRVHGLPAVYETYLRPDSVHTSLVAGVAWMDTRLLQARLYSGSYVPGGGPWRYTAPVRPSAAASLVAAFNGGFRMKDARGGYYSEGRTVRPLRPGAASLVFRRDGTVTVADWGRDATLTPDVVAVRQNLRLLVDHGSPVPGLDANDTRVWGYTVSNRVYVWRSGVGVTADGALVYAAGPGLNITSLADLLVRAGAVRGMELDINTDWVNFSVFTPPSAGAPAAASNGADLLPAMKGKPGRYFASYWARDFVALSARQGSTS